MPNEAALLASGGMDWVKLISGIARSCHGRSVNGIGCVTNLTRLARPSQNISRLSEPNRCPLYPRKRTFAVHSPCPLWANSGLMHCNLIGETWNVSQHTPGLARSADPQGPLDRRTSFDQPNNAG
jgi:hypothetical protein